MSDEFYVGYLPKAPAGVRRFLRRWIIGGFVVASALALILVYGQQPFAPSVLEYGNVRPFSGTIEAKPYPVLVADEERYLLVGPGKRGADALVAGFDGKRVTLQAELIARPGQQMLEVMPGSVHEDGPGAAPLAEVDLGAVALTGEIVDSKCWTGVMNPGRDKVHRDCAARCISGGAPPLLVSTTRTGSPEVFQLVGPDGRQLGRELLRYVAEPVTVRGELSRRGTTLIVRADPASIQRQK